MIKKRVIFWKKKVNVEEKPLFLFLVSLIYTLLELHNNTSFSVNLPALFHPSKALDNPIKKTFSEV